MLKFIFRFMGHLITFLSCILPLQLAGAIILLVYLPIHLELIRRDPKRSIKLPYLLRWFDNADLYVARKTSTYRSVFGSGYWNLYNWLAWRNPLNYFGYKVLGITNPTLLRWPDDDVGDATGCHEGLRYIEIELNDHLYYEYYYIKKWSASKCLRVRIGWKLAGVHSGSIAQWVFVISPWHSYNGV